MKISLLYDSVALPRDRGPRLLPYDSTYPFLLDRRLKDRFGGEAPYVLDNGTPSRTVDDVLHDWPELVRLKRPDVVVVQVGRADCQPRLLLRRERRLLRRLPARKLRRRLREWAKAKRLSLLPLVGGRVQVAPGRFRHKLEAIVRHAAEEGVRALVLIGILPVEGEETRRRHPGYRENVVNYNRMLLAFDGRPGVTVLDLEALARRDGGAGRLTDDGLQFNELGHRRVAEALEALVADLVSAGERRAAP